MPVSDAPDDEPETLAGAGQPDAEELDRLAQVFVEQARRGEAPSIETVAREHPDLAADIRELFPVLAIFEGLKAEDAVTETRPSRTPARVGDYELGRELGRGGMGTVYEGRRVGDGDGPARVAVKLIHAHLLERPEYLARFLQEAAAGRRIEHENVVKTLETGVVDVSEEEVPYILLEYVEGQNLRALLKEVEVVPERLCRHVGTRLADALGSVHAAGLVHRDVKPENVVITNDETVKLMDLGVAVVQDRLQRLSRTGEFVGSLLYASPGQVAGEDPEPRWDLHALGILLYELATGQHPARDSGLRWLRANEATRSTLTHRDALTHISPFFATVIECLLVAEEDLAFGTAAELRDVLAEGEASAWWIARRESSRESSLGPQRAARSTAFYGRREEWKALDRALEAATAGRGQVLLLEGEAGIGKTRLVEEWVASQRATQESPRVVLLSHGPGGAIGDESQLAAALAEILGPDRLEERLATLLASRARLAPGLARRLRGESAPPEGGSYDAAWMGLLHALARKRPVLVIAEDLHFAAAEDVDRFLYFARAVSYGRILLVGTFRPQPEPAGVRELLMLEHATHRTLEGLDTQACHDLLLEAAAATPQLDESVARLAERSDRNPMFLLELVRRARRHAAGPSTSQTTVPDSIRGFLLARIGALAPSDRELLDTAACQGYEFDPVLIAEASGAGRVDALKRFGRMERGHGLLRPAGRHYRFQHHLVQEVLYAELHPALRETWHAALGGALEARIQEPTGEDAVTLCTQFLKGGEPLRARPYVRQALEYLESEYMLYLASSELAAMALNVEGLLTGADRACALEVHGRACVGRAQLDEGLVALEEALDLACEADETAMEVDILVTLAWLARHRESAEAGIRILERAADRARAARDAARESVALSRLAIELVNLGRYDEADGTLKHAFEALGDVDDSFARCQLTGDLASLRILQGRLAEAQDLLAETDRLAHEIGNLPSEFFNTAELGRLCFRMGRYEEAQKHVRHALDCGRQLGMHHRDAFLLFNMGRGLVRLGRPEEAQRRFREAQEIARRRGDRNLDVSATVELALVRAGRGAVGEALDEFDTACASNEGLERDSLHLGAIRCTGLLARLGRFDEAERAIGAAEEAWAERHTPPLRVRLIAARAHLREQQGRYDEAIRHYEEAAALAEAASLVTAPYVFAGSRCLLRAGRDEEAEEGLREAHAWAREHGVPSIAVLAQVHLAGRPGGDVLAARVALEQHAERLTAWDRIEAHLALWEAEGDETSLESAWRELKQLQLSVPVKDQERMLTDVDLHRRVAQAWQEQIR